MKEAMEIADKKEDEIVFCDTEYIYIYIMQP